MQSYPWSIQTKWHKHFSFPAHNVPARPSAADEVRLGTFPLKLKGSGWAASTYLQDSASTSWTNWFEKTTVREMFSLELCASGSSQEPEFSVPECLHEIPRCLFQYHFSIISVTYGGALHQTSTICKLTQLQLRIHRDLLQCVPFNHPHSASKQSPVLPFRSLNTGQCRTLDLPGSLCNPVHLNHEVSAALQCHHLGEDSAPKKFKDVQSRCKSWTILQPSKSFRFGFGSFSQKF